MAYFKIISHTFLEKLRKTTKISGQPKSSVLATNFNKEVNLYQTKRN